MLTEAIKRFFGSHNERIIRSKYLIVDKINALEAEYKLLKDEEFPAKTELFKSRYQQSESLDDLLPEAFALVREASIRTLGMRHFDVQLIGGMVLNTGNIAEMRTGEGKTLVATLPAYLNALTDQGVHIVTVNDYLAKRDAVWMSKIYGFLGLMTGAVLSGMPHEKRCRAYAADVTYGTNSEFGFDYLRRNMVFSKQERAQRELNFAIVDEVDSILIDEARTPLVISGMTDDETDMYVAINRIVPALKRQNSEEAIETEDVQDQGDFIVDEKTKQIHLTEAGQDQVELLLQKNNILAGGLYDPANAYILYYVNAALRAHTVFEKNIDYIVDKNQIVIIDEFTGRKMEGRRWSDGLHQAIEAKENVPIQHENQTLATITYQNYFRLYSKLSGMTGTADTEAREFHQIYDLDVMVIPTYKPMIRDDQSDMILLTAKEKFLAIIDDVKNCQSKKQPVLVGTTSIEVSEYISKLLKKEKIKHQVLNAKFHQQEAEIISNAGLLGAVTVATNMAGRGTDIVLGGNYEAELKALGEATPEKINKHKEDWQHRHRRVIESGGLRVIGTERHESRRIDNQLRGRSGRQGDPGSSCFYISLEDNLMRIFASEKISALVQKLGMKNTEVIESAIVTRAIENAQKKVEGHNFDIRKNLLEFDDVANEQRKVIYEQRNELLERDDISDNIKAIRSDLIDMLIDQYIPPQSNENHWNLVGLKDTLIHEFGISISIEDIQKSVPAQTLHDMIRENMDKLMEQKEQICGLELMREVEKTIMLSVLDRYWKEHLSAMDHLRDGVSLRGYAAKNPKQEYKREAFGMFMQMLEHIKRDVVAFLTKVDVNLSQQGTSSPARTRGKNQHYSFGKEAESNTMSQPTKNKKIGRNVPCPCGSGKKYKHCHGR